MSIRGPSHGIRMLAVLALCPILVPAKAALAQTPSARVRVEPPEVTVGDRFRLVLEISGVRKIEHVSRPWLLGMSRWPFETAVGVKVWRAQAEAAESSFTLSFEQVARTAGSYEVGPIQITADGQNLTTEPVTVHVNPPEGAETTIVARVTGERIRVGDSFGLSAEVRGSSFAEHEFILPDIFDFAESDGGSSSGFARTWRLRAVAPGEFVIPPVRVTGPGGTYESEPLTVVIEPLEVEVHATVEAESIWVGGEFNVKVGVRGAGELDQEPVLPETGAFAEFVELVDSSSALRGPVRVSRVERVYRFRALRAGRFEIGPVRVAAGGGTLATDPITIVVDEAPMLEEDPPISLRLVGSPDKTRAYVNEPVAVTYAFVYDPFPGTPPSPGTVSWPSLDGFRVLDRSGSRGGSRELLVDGRSFRERGLQGMALVPVRPGLLTVESVFAEARTRAMTSIVLASEPFTVEVLPLPDEGRPASFRGFVGTISIHSWVDRTRVAVGETMTLEVEVSVDGHVESLPEPEIHFADGFTVSDREVSTDFRNRQGLSGSRTYVYHLAAVAPGSYRIPAVEMSYFDAESESYGTARGQPFSITIVTGGRDAR